MIKNAVISGALIQKNPQQVSTQFVNVEAIEDYITKACFEQELLKINRKYPKDIMLY